MKKIMAPGLALCVSLAAPVALADVVITIREASKFVGEDSATASEFLHDASGGNTVTLWSRENRMARVDANSRMIGKLDLGETYIIDDMAKTCTLIKRDSAASNVNIRPVQDFRKTGESKTIGLWQADGYELTVSGNADDVNKVALWVSDEATLGLDNYRAYIESVTAPDNAWMAKSLDLGGYPVRQEIQVGPLAMWSEIESIEEKDPPAGIYEVPRGYAGCN
jgi:hypothetical protein